MANTNLRSFEIELTERDTRYILYAVSELMNKLEEEVRKDPDGEEDITSMYADDILTLRDIQRRLRERAIPVFGEGGLTVSYETL